MTYKPFPPPPPGPAPKGRPNPLAPGQALQYVGARYVPVFAEPTEWSSQRVYERLTIVTYMGGSYTSKIDVPAGIPPTNTEYWALTGNYNAQTEQYRQEVESLQHIVDANTDDITELQAVQAQHTTDLTSINQSITNLTAGQQNLIPRMAAAEAKNTEQDTSLSQHGSQINTIMGNINTMTDELTQHQSQINTNMGNINTLTFELKEANKRDNHGKLLVVSDSYGVAGYGNWQSYFISYMGRTEGSTAWALGRPSSNLASGGWLSFIQQWVAANPSEVTNISTIVLGGGINDSTPEWYNKVRTEMLNLSNYVNSTFTNCNVYLAYFGWALDTSPILGGRTANYREYVQKVYATAPEFGMNYLSGVELVLHNRSLLAADQLHPTEEGGKQIGMALTAALKAGPPCINYGAYANITPLNAGETATGPINQYIYYNTLITQFQNFSVAGISIPFSSAEWIAVCNCELQLSNNMPPVNAIVSARIDNTWTITNADIKCEDNKVWIRILNFNDQGNFLSGTLNQLFSITFMISQPPMMS